MSGTIPADVLGSVLFLTRKGKEMDKISAIRCTVNTESVTEADILDAADALWEESEGQGYDRESLAEALSLPADHPAITERVLLAVNHC